MAEYIEREALYHKIKSYIARIIYRGHEDIPLSKDSCNPTEWMKGYEKGAMEVCNTTMNFPAADVVEVDKVAELLCLSFGGDTCACNFNGNDEWLWEKCKYEETECPYPKDELGCWKEYVKAMLAKMDGKEVEGE